MELGNEMMMMIHDEPLRWYPGVIACLIRQRTLKIVKKELQAKGVGIRDVTQADLVRLAEAYFLAHSAECVRVAIDTIRVADDLRKLAEAEAKRRAKQPKDVTPPRYRITLSKEVQIDG
jgi:hypothetical protein